MGLRRWGVSLADAQSLSAVYRALKRLENLLGRTPVNGDVVHVTTTYTVVDSDELVTAATAGGAFSITLPPVATNKGRRFTVLKTDASANNLTLDGNASETINGATTVVWNTQYSFRTVESDGAVWWIVATG